MPAYRIKCEVIKITGDKINCPGGTRMKIGSEFSIGVVTPAGMCVRSYSSIYPVAMAMRFSEETVWERGQGYVDVSCPESNVVYRLTRVKGDEKSKETSQ